MPSEMSAVKTLIVGYGSIGQRHCRNLKQLDPDMAITVLRRPGSKGDQQGNLPTVYSIEEALQAAPKAALICSPAACHIDTALALADKGVHLFIEKPLAHNETGVKELIERANSKQLVLMVGYNFRFYKPLQVLKQVLMEGKIGKVLSVRSEVGQYLPDWRPDVDYRQTASARADLGGGVVLELSHEFDYLRYLLGDVESVWGRTAHVSGLELDVEDTADVMLEFSDKTLATVHLNMVQQHVSRTCTVVGSEGSLSLDFIKHSLLFMPGAKLAPETIFHDSDYDLNETYLAELSHFFDCIERQAEPLITGADAWRTLQVALAVKASSARKQAMKLKQI
ncbi:Gfo/Idh/MocA family oxidoreductase [Oligoflexia bacterium]|nr:Gfo/Idh/MocA family oxidoreductase [Oligoflexia bacterium]